MKKLIFSCITCFATVSSLQAATSGLAESLLEYEAITTALGTNPLFENVIDPTEFIIDIKRITKEVDVTGRVRYKIVTALPGFQLDSSRSSSSHHHHHHHHQDRHTYIVTLQVTPNAGIGPNQITVLEIRETHR